MPGLEQEGIERTLLEIERELTTLGIPAGNKEGDIITLKVALSKEARTRFLMLPRVKDVLVRAD